MFSDAAPQSQSPEPLDLLVAATPNRALLDFIKAEPMLARTVFQGFAVREQSLTRGLVRQRLEHELRKQPELAEALFTRWGEVYADLISLLNAPDFTPSAESLSPLLKDFGESPVAYALQHAESAEVRAWADRLAEVRNAVPAETVAQPTPPSRQGAPDLQQITTLRTQLSTVQAQFRALQHEYDLLKKDAEHQKALLDRAAETETLLRKQLEITRGQIEREQRRAKKAEEDANQLRKQQRQQSAVTSPAAPAPVSAEIAATINEAIAVLRRGLSLAGPEAPTPSAATEHPAPPTPAPTPRRHPVQNPAEPGITLPTQHGKKTFTLPRILMALRRNEADFIDDVRDGIALLASQPLRERQALETLEKAGIPRLILAGPLRPAVVDGSNVANMSPERHARLAYLDQIQRSAWEEGYFPVIIVVDASLRHQIDQPDHLMTRIERGEIIMAPPGTSGDELLIELATEQHAVLITNDRMSNWPAAKSLDKRHIEMNQDRVQIGHFHGRTWFHW